MITINNKNIDNIKFGNKIIGTVYYGVHIVWSAFSKIWRSKNIWKTKATWKS